MGDKQNFEVSTWADAEVKPGPGNPEHPEHEAWLAGQDQDNDDEQADEPETGQEKP